ncbi:MAG: PEP-CTERM-box response regulator transcription factor [Gemmatimonadaceae bacterium]|nr:PEP-CTERM-box response regulator transcription factor [Acetobacteraceae bacterium]
MSKLTPKALPKLLIVEDDMGLCSQYRWAFPTCEVVFAHTRTQAIAMAQKERPAVAIMDLGLPPDPDGVSEGFATLDSLARQVPNTKIIVATSHGDRTHALRAIAAGAYDFCEKPIDIDMLSTIIARSLRMQTLEDENRRLSDQPAASPIKNIVTSDPGMLKVCRDIEKLAAANVSALLLGESGTGKEALARALHDLGPRARQPFVAINCGAIPEALLESELFGHERGAFTGAVKQTLGKIELANKGTLFLDEIGDLPHPLQVKLLRFLQDQRVERIGGRAPIQVDVRVVSATNQMLQDQVDQGRFRGDLFYRLNPVTVRIPPLRERGGDTVLLARHFLAIYAREFGRPVKGFGDDALAAIGAHSWPGNIRELENRMKRAVLMTEQRMISAADLELAPGVEDMTAYDLRAARSRAERDVVQRALARSNGTLATAARLLGISRPTLYTLLEAHGLSADSGHEAGLSADGDIVPHDATS